MVTNPSAAAGAYTSIAKIVDNLRGAAKANNVGQDESNFSDIVESVLSNVTASGAVTEEQAQKLANGNADVLDLVTAVAETELAVETLVTVRDRVISAYQDILNMPI